MQPITDLTGFSHDTNERLRVDRAVMAAHLGRVNTDITPEEHILDLLHRAQPPNALDQSQEEPLLTNREVAALLDALDAIHGLLGLRRDVYGEDVRDSLADRAHAVARIALTPHLDHDKLWSDENRP